MVIVEKELLLGLHAVLGTFALLFGIADGFLGLAGGLAVGRAFHVLAGFFAFFTMVFRRSHV